MHAITLSRRGFLITGGATGLVAGFMTPSLAAWDPSGAITPTAPTFDPTLWYSIDAKGIVTVNIIRAEMGQHVGTAIARILADELEVNWEDVRISHVDTDPKWGVMVTGGSWSVWQSFPVYSQAGAAGRIALIEAAAAILNVAPADCTAYDGVIAGGGKAVTCAEIVAKGLTRSFTADELAAMPIKPAAERKLIGKPVLALDWQARPMGLSSTASTPRSRGWSTRDLCFRPPATARSRRRWMIRRRRGRRAISPA